MMNCANQFLAECQPGHLGYGIDYKRLSKQTDRDLYRKTRKEKRGGFAVNVINRVVNMALKHYQMKVC